MAEGASFEATGRPRLDIPASLGADIVDGARIEAGCGYVEATAPLPVPDEKSHVRGLVLEHRQLAEQRGAEPVFVRFEERHRVATMVAAPPTGHAVRAIGIGNTFDRRKTHGAFC